MILKEKELEVLLIFFINQYLKDKDISIKEYQLTINNALLLQAVIQYQDHLIDLHASCLLEYKNKQLCFCQIDGTVEYIFLKLPLLTTLQQLIQDPFITFKENSCFIDIELPIESIEIKDDEVIIKLLKQHD